ncbi:30S ribosomal protein S12 methylthiotransferase RimO [Desulfoscipio geothermicus]|uniref:Ribosomal protein uS12 methylthiotransferase RimO n=1 Tax=Desulfoscipio geothermicus DSM 3669 TaxID=1121426 RepID=A0A1I6D8R8_9FIRM|nr:30S ribosomal protein S12 methylthiotransferase RimO [Desulfoscipio geothermicus]SFR01856.1 SSU ribosomal protein S12P methylthiotransferase [Desulfoscipio geothermicus DSM 3669]
MSTVIGFISLGCPKNRVDTETMLGCLEGAGYTLTGDLAEAEIIVINTCGFITAAKEESIEAILEAARYKKTGRCRYLLVAGCLPQRYGRELLQEMPEIDGVMGTGAVPEIIAALDRMQADERVLAVHDPGYIDHAPAPRKLTTPGHTAYLKIAEGCDNCCSYCAIPAIRGPYRSRPMDVVLAEAQDLCARGVRELVVVAQETTRYGLDLYGRYALRELLQGLVALEDCRWIRLMYCYPTSFTDDLIELIASAEKICPYIDLPLQHINNRILKMMNRRGNKEVIVNLITKLRRSVPGLVLRTTFIAGFPGETEEEFAELLDFMERVKFERAGVFGFSPEEGTPAAALPGRLDEETIAARVDKAMRLQQGISLAYNRQQVGREVQVLVEGWDDEAKMYWGRTRADAPEIDGRVFFTSYDDVRAGDFVQVKILAAAEYDLSGVRTK